MMRWFAFLFGKQTVEKQLDAELRFHIEQETRRYVAAGMSVEEARRTARLDFGGLDQIKEECRDARPTRWLEDFAQDARYGCRILAKNPGITVGAGPADVRRLVVRQALAPVVLGISGGLIGAWYLTRFMSTLLYQVEPQDPLTIIAASGAMFLIALAARYLPALRASRIDPSKALHQD